jgi:hypothetical protein
VARGADSRDEASVLSIGAIYGGPEFSHQPGVPWKPAIQVLMNRVIDLRRGVESPLNINVVFHVPGSLLAPEFSGSRTGSFRKRDRLLMVQVALPIETPDDQSGYLISAVRDAIETVEVWNRRKDRRFDLSVIRSMLAQL